MSPLELSPTEAHRLLSHFLKTHRLGSNRPIKLPKPYGEIVGAFERYWRHDIDLKELTKQCGWAEMPKYSSKFVGLI